jgi:hypothetical protein
VEQDCAALRLLERLRKAAREGETPSTADLQAERIYGLRPVNRAGDLRQGKYNGTHYDIERIDCSNGVYRWRLHEPPRLGYPKDKRQDVFPLSPGQCQREKVTVEWKNRPRLTGLPLFDLGLQS